MAFTKNITAAVIAVCLASSAFAGEYTEIYNAPPVGAAVRSFLPFKLHYDQSGDYLLTALYVDPAIPESNNIEPSTNTSADTSMLINSFSIPFPFNSASLSKNADLTIKKAAAAISSGNHSVVIGRADTIGASDYNLNLSEKRARNIATRLARYGVNPQNIDISAVGESEPVTNCSDIRSRKKRISCEAPNRRSLIKIYAAEQ